MRGHEVGDDVADEVAHHDPGQECRKHKTFEDVVRDKGSPPVEWLSSKHLHAIGNVSTASGVTLCLPETSHHIFNVAVASLNIDLIERNMQFHCPHLAIGLPEGLDGCVEVLSDSVGASVPESDSLDEVEAEGVVAEWEGYFEGADQVGEMDSAVRHVVNSSSQGHI